MANTKKTSKAPKTTLSIVRGDIKLCLIKFSDRKQYTLVYDNGRGWNCIGTVRHPGLWNEAVERLLTDT